MINPKLKDELDKKQFWSEESKFNKDCDNIHDMPYVFRKVVYDHLNKIPLDRMEKDQNYFASFEKGIYCVIEPYKCYIVHVNFPIYDIEKREETNKALGMNFEIKHDEIDQLLLEEIDG